MMDQLTEKEVEIEDLKVQLKNAVTDRQTRSAKLPDPPTLTDGLKPSFDAWKRAVGNKIRHNADHFPIEDAKLGYLLSRVEQPASDILKPYLEDPTLTPTLVAQAFEILEQVYGTPSKETSRYMVKFEALSQGQMEFGLIVAEFHRVAAPLRRDAGSLAMGF